MLPHLFLTLLSMIVKNCPTFLYHEGLTNMWGNGLWLTKVKWIKMDQKLAAKKREC